MIAGNFYLQLTQGCPFYTLVVVCIFEIQNDRHEVSCFFGGFFQNRSRVNLISITALMSYLAFADP